MKRIFVAIMALGALVSCSKDELVSVNRQAIQFGNAFVENSTRATDPSYGGTTASLTSFDVYGTVTGTAGTVNIFNGDKVTGAIGSSVWTCTNNQYWIDGARYEFAAVVDADGVTQDTDNNMPTALTYNTRGQKDLLYATATATGQASGNDKVNFSFSHLLSKAQFTVKSNTEGGYYYSVKDIKVNNFETGTYTIANGTWAGTTAKDIEFGAIEKVTKTDANGKTNATQMLLIPTTADFKVSFTVELWNDKGTEATTDDVKLSTVTYSGNTAKTVSQDLVKGNAYDFNLSLSVGEKIEFTVTTAPTWTPATSGTTVTL